jgi:RNA polymerase sigma factor (sigma-70 family)
MEKLLLSVLPDIPDVVRNACHHLGHHPDQMELDGMVQEIILLLMKDNYRVLKSFDPESDDLKSKFSKWLYTIAWRRALRRFQKQSRLVRLEEIPTGHLVLPPNQEAAVASQERDKQLKAALEKLPPRKRLLYDLLSRELSAKEIALEMDIQPESVSPMKNAMIKKIQQILKNDGKMKGDGQTG